MGNCLRHESEMHWAGEDWDDVTTEDEDHHHNHHHSSKTSNKSKTVVVTGDSKSSDHGIKIRLTKKEFQDLLSKVNVLDHYTFHQHVFSCPNLINQYEETNQLQSSWRPVLQSIPEVN